MKANKKAICQDFTNSHFRYINIADCKAFGHQSSICAIAQLYFDFCRIALKRLEEKDGLVFKALTGDSGDFYSVLAAAYTDQRIISLSISVPHISSL